MMEHMVESRPMSIKLDRITCGMTLTVATGQCQIPRAIQKISGNHRRILLLTVLMVIHGLMKPVLLLKENVLQVLVRLNIVLVLARLNIVQVLVLVQVLSGRIGRQVLKV